MALASAAFLSPEHAPGCDASAQATPFTPGNYCWFFETEITNNSGSDVTDGMFRFEANNAGMIAANQLDPLAWTVYSTSGSFSNQSATEINGLGATDGAWWVQVPGLLTDGTTRTVTTYMKNAQQQRDAGISFTGREEVSIPDGSETDMADDADGISFVITVYDDTPRDEIILDKMNDISSSGYAVGLEDDGAGGLDITFWSNGSTGGSLLTCTHDYEPAWIGERKEWTIVGDLNGFGPNDMYIFDEDSLECNADGASNPFSNTTNTLLVGDTDGCFCGMTEPLSGAVVHGIRAWTGISISNWITEPFSQGTQVMNHTFDPDKMTELTTLEPTYTGSIVEAFGNVALDASYTFVRPQTGFVINNGIPALVSGAPLPSVPSTVFDVAGSPIDSSIFENTENTRLPFYGWVSPVIDDMRMSREAAWLIVLFVPSFILGLATLLLYPQSLAVVAAMGLPYAYGVAGELIEPWWILIWGMAILATWGIRNWRTQS